MAKAEIPELIQARIRRGRFRRDALKAQWDECIKFWRGDQYVFRFGKSNLSSLPTTVSSGTDSKPPHRVRLTRNLLIDHVATEVAAAIQRTPSFEINPTTIDPEDVSAARLSEKVAIYGYDAWHFREVI